ncbi:MAG: RagB/SusD family nutrient uptake outer membrane protein [Chitinophagaceae bacterium]|nr:RagB/SusD family nutrient uptake outer membrane protein [Chitinophagaceae bacterium]
MKRRDFLNTIAAIFLIISVQSCKKYLDAKPDSTLQTIENLNDLRRLLDNFLLINCSYPGLGDVLADDYYFTDQDLFNSDMAQRNFHTWVREDDTEPLWRNPYEVIMTANIVLDELPGVEYQTTEQQERNDIMGSALFLRAYYFYGLAQLFANPYNNNNNKDSDLGIPLRLNSDINTKVDRASVKETYERIIADFKQAAPLLSNSPSFKSRPGKGATYGALARTYLTMGEYDSALHYSNKYLSIHDSLANYNLLSASTTPLQDRFQKEVIFVMRSATISVLGGNRPKVDSVLFRSYNDSDLRKTIHFRMSVGRPIYRGDFDGSVISSVFSFNGIYTNEIYLVRAECYARKNQMSEALSDLNTLLVSRYVSGQFNPFTAIDANDALAKVLLERKKELMRRGLRWTDIRRLNNIPPVNSIKPVRNIFTQSFTLPEKPYLLLLPVGAIQLGGLQQN